VRDILGYVGLAARAAALCLVFGALLGIPRPAGAATRSCGCGQSPPVSAGSEATIAIHVADYPDARDGSYLLYVPAGYDSETPMPLLLGFHGWTSSPSVLRQTSGLETSADSHGFVPAFLEGVDYPEAGRGWAFPGCNASPAVGQTDALGRRAVCSSGDTYSCDASTCPSASCADQCGCDATQCQCVTNQGSNCNWCGCVNDEAFARAVLDDVSKRLCVDLDRVYATGMSAGGMITSWLSGRAHDVFAAFVPVSGTDPRDFYDLPPSDSDAGVMWIHGTQDNTVPHDGSPASDGYFYEAASAEAQRVAAAYQCDASPSAWPVLLPLEGRPHLAEGRWLPGIGALGQPVADGIPAAPQPRRGSAELRRPSFRLVDETVGSGCARARAQRLVRQRRHPGQPDGAVHLPGLAVLPGQGLRERGRPDRGCIGALPSASQRKLMKSQARVVIVGGGMMGVGLLYHLAKEGWTDVVLVEKGELTSGSTWHSAGQCPSFIGDYTMAMVHHVSNTLYPKLEELTGQYTSWHGCGGIRLATQRAELEWFKHVADIAKHIGYRMEVIGPDEIRRIHPFLDTTGVIAGAWTLDDGHVDPAGTCNAMAKGARDMGASIVRRSTSISSPSRSRSSSTATRRFRSCETLRPRATTVRSRSRR
jgi:glycine/D-amino acid oxidase-like deaminating enzyme